ncbi:2,3-dihydro-2,3-dihydroxybenzoate dehydrogenase [Allocatelliglobosispora scoriae]|uniref:2,3-dihydro-2,3-dihydroxybenzoate dehydrogenase n=1 Tax=Allocatelliglobosispora scoriae TaxID=643052 RepID=A0A841C192_9ACTN|nr:2,3-dihydro-2,3-dihydroxybenzoate dehydrogenase [Allocatelliglobosispora scoriae]MBB5873636.1 2,3-dihydro-2,3-dihydroxybenzoate dehydrogenase [Allocatelliglobosispora scoriae]
MHTQIALVTGAASGIGAAVAAELAQQGVVVAAADTNESALAEQVEKITSNGYAARAYSIDVRDPVAVHEAINAIERDLGPIGILVNVAGVLRTAPILELTDDDWQTVFSVNTVGVFNISQAVARGMVARRSGCVVTVGSNSAAVPRMHMAAYCAAKAASTMFTKCLGLELAEYGIRCNIVAPGSTDTPMLRSMWADGYGRQSVLDGAADRYRIGIPLRKLAEPADVAHAVAFLASDQASHITMHELCVDGGAALGA